MSGALAVAACWSSGAGTQPAPIRTRRVGNGRAIAVVAAREGASVACADIDAEAAEVTARLVEAEGAAPC